MRSVMAKGYFRLYGAAAKMLIWVDRANFFEDRKETGKN
jgi:hypothetical protein